MIIVTVLGIAMALPLGFYLLLHPINQMTQGWNNKSHIDLYLKNKITIAQGKSLVVALQRNPKIQRANLITPEEGLNSFIKGTEFKEVTHYLTENPLPAVIEVEPIATCMEPEALNALANKLQTLPEVQMVQLNRVWVARLYTIIQLAQRFIYLIGLIVGGGVIFIIGSTIHLAMGQENEEIAVLQLLGASNGFIHRPFLYRGALYGSLGACLALFLLSSAMMWLKTPIERLAYLYNSNFQLVIFHAADLMIIILIGGLLGLMGAYLALKSLQPTLQ